MLCTSPCDAVMSRLSPDAVPVDESGRAAKAASPGKADRSARQQDAHFLLCVCRHNELTAVSATGKTQF